MKYFVNYSGTKETFKDLEELYYKYIVFIEGGDLIYTHGHYYGDLKDAFEALKVEISDSINTLKEQVNTTDTDLYNNIDSLSNNLADNVDKLAKMITSNTKSILDLIDVLVNADASTAINTFNEIVAFLEGIENSEDLDSIIASIEQLIANVNKSLEEHLTESLEIFITRSEVVDNYITKTEVADNYATTETLNLAVQAVNSNINGVNQSINSTLQNVNEKANKADASATDALNLIEGIQGNLSSFALKSAIPTKISQLINDSDFVVDDYIDYSKYSNGVYAVTTTGSLIDYNTADSSCIAVALIVNEHKFMISKDIATNGTNSSLYWGNKLNPKDLVGLTNYSTVDGTNVSGFLLKPDGSFGGSIHLSNDFTTWTTGAMSDFNGKTNTAAIIASYTEYGIDMDNRDMCKSLETFNASEEAAGRKHDWYVPAVGQLALIYLNRTEINNAFTKIGGTILSYTHWSSSECSSGKAWFVNLDSGYIYPLAKQLDFRVRFIRDLSSSSKPLKERVSDLESQMVTGDVKYIRKVTALPDNPDSNTLYILT